MALEIDSPELRSKIPSDSQVSLISSPPSLKSLSIVPTTTSSLSLSTPIVKFAPLPQLSPRKRRSTVPLGMAARGQLIPRRPGHRGQKVPPMWTDEGFEEYWLQQEELAAQHARFTAYAIYAAARKDEEEEDESGSEHDWHPRRWKKNGGQVDEDDPLHTLGRIVKGAGRTLWKRVSNKDVAAAAGAATSIPKEGSNTASPAPTKVRRRSLALRPILAPITTPNVDDQPEAKEGRVWEQEIENTFLRDISQTATIVDGRVYSHFTSKVEALTRSPPPSPSVSFPKRMSSFMRPGGAKKSLVSL